MTTPDPLGVTRNRPLAVVTGASSGIGLELAKQFAEHDFDVVMAAEDEFIDKAADEIRALGVTAFTSRVDLSTHDGVERFHRELLDLARPIDALALNAGVGV